MTRAVDGERRWLASASRLEKALILWIPSLNVVPLVWALWTNHPGWTTFFACVSLAHKAMFVRWMTRSEADPSALSP